MIGKTEYTKSLCGSLTETGSKVDLKKVRVKVADHLKEKFLKLKEY